MKRNMILTVFAGLLLLTGCGSTETSSPSAAKTTSANTTAAAQTNANTTAKQTTAAATTAKQTTVSKSTASAKTEEQWLFGTSNFNMVLSGIEAKTWTDQIQAQKAVTLSDKKTYLQNFKMYNFSNPDEPAFALILSKQSGWVFTDGTNMWEAPQTLRNEMCRKLLDNFKETGPRGNGQDTDAAFTMRAEDLPEGGFWLNVYYKCDKMKDICCATDVSLKDSSGKAYDVQLVANNLPMDGNEGFVFTAVQPDLPCGKYQLTINGVSAAFSVISVKDYIAANP